MTDPEVRDTSVGIPGQRRLRHGDITRFRTSGHLASWAGLMPRHHESDVKVISEHVTRQGSRMLGWAVTEAI
jgi:transposase